MSGGEDEDAKEMERKVYSRKKSFKSVKNSRSSSNLLREQQPRAQAMGSDGMNFARKSVDSGFEEGSDRFPGQNRDGLVGKGGFMRQESRVRINLSMKSKNEIRELRRKLEAERDVVRSLMRKIEANEGQKNDQMLNNARADKVMSGVGPPRMSKPLNQLSVFVSENNKSGANNTEKEKRTPKANKLYRNSEFLLAKDKFPPPESNKNAKANKKKGGGSEVGKFPNQVLKSCAALLERLMKHKHGWVFNTPVDTVGLGLHDYFEIIKKPMDLGTVKNRLSQNLYKSPREFAEDVRLTFQNAMTYNPKEQDVYLMAEQLAKMFEEKWAPIEADYMRDSKHAVNTDMVSPTPTPASRKAPPKLKARTDAKILDRSESRNYNVDPKQKPMNNARSGRVPLPKKPKAKDPNKREMTYDEKQKLSMDLQSLPSEKLEMVVQIIKKRNFDLTQQDDEIEVDIDTVDTETLWELDRFITNYKKSLNKNKRKAEIITQLTADPEQIPQEKIPSSVVAEAEKGSGTDEERFVSPPARVEEPRKNDTNQGANQSSSCSDSRSSSSDSEGESSAGDGADGEGSSKD